MTATSSAVRMPLIQPARLRCGAPPVLSATVNLQDTIQQTTASNMVVIYSKSWCPYCAQCKQLFDDMKQPYTVVELDEREDGEQLQAALLEMTQQRTVPNVFVAGQHLGGNDDTQQAARSGELAALLGASPSPPASFAAARVVPTGAGSSATAAQLKAVGDFKMITETEANVRKTVGVGLGLATAAIYATAGMSYTTLSTGIFVALSTYRTGAEYQ